MDIYNFVAINVSKKKCKGLSFILNVAMKCNTINTWPKDKTSPQCNVKTKLMHQV